LNFATLALLLEHPFVRPALHGAMLLAGRDVLNS
jgi:hypothetical protein